MNTLRSQALTYEGPLLPLLHYGIPFTKREEFEAAWPHILKLKSKGAPIILRRGSSFWLDGASQGVCIHTPPAGTKPLHSPELNLSRLETTNYIELVVDGNIVDLNRISLPPETPIIDERFKTAPTTSRAKKRKAAKTMHSEVEGKWKINPDQSSAMLRSPLMPIDDRQILLCRSKGIGMCAMQVGRFF